MSHECVFVSHVQKILVHMGPWVYRFQGINPILNLDGLKMSQISSDIVSNVRSYPRRSMGLPSMPIRWGGVWGGSPIPVPDRSCMGRLQSQSIFGSRKTLPKGFFASFPRHSMQLLYMPISWGGLGGQWGGFLASKPSHLSRQNAARRSTGAPSR